ncbi:MAG: hypothetical protein CME62_04780 [Halobacteriovoraceae bacterium]|nr:hypothetical protein [Halobacteriovoraceae bacterium]|tara:strand:- start:3281 stop:4381 length:1101 start_codon:yes stop_codon:yes gene_type:complete
MENFFIITPIGLENITLAEFKEKWGYFQDSPEMSAQVVKGGVEVQCDLSHGLALNHILRTPTRILLRLKTQKCRDLPKLYKIIKKIEWKNLLCHEEVNFQVTAKKSRLIHTTKIEKTARDAIADYFQANHLKSKVLEEFKEKPLPTLFLRLFEDELTISLDTTGERLHKRGQSFSKAKAPLRESTAQSLLRYLIKDIDNAKDNILIDPMCGSGTFLRETMHMNDLIMREFAYHSLKINTEMPKMDNKASELFSGFYGFDLNKELIAENQKNYPQINFEENDLFQAEFPESLKNQIVIVNPPYGKRIKINESKSNYFAKLVKTVEKKLNPSALGLIIPTPYDKGLSGEKLYFNQNGVKVCFLKRLKS